LDELLDRGGCMFIAHLLSLLPYAVVLKCCESQVQGSLIPAGRQLPSEVLKLLLGQSEVIPECEGLVLVNPVPKAN